MAAFSSIELLFGVGLAATLGGLAIGQTVHSADDARAAGAARYVASRFRDARMEAVARGATVAVAVTRTDSGFSLTPYLDGNGNGVLARDISGGIDLPTQPPEVLADRFPGVDFGTLPDLPSPDATDTPPGADPVRLGVTDRASFTPTGTASAGSLYLLGRGRRQYVVRIFAETGRTRILRYDEASRSWMAVSGL